MQEEKEEKLEMKVYELGFLVIPTVVEEKLPEIVSNIKAVIEEDGGLFITEEYPKIRALSYEMVKKVDVQRTIFKQAYFGWIKFEINSSNLDKIKKSLEKNHDILRFLLIKTVQENTLFSHKVFAKKDKVSYRKPSETEGAIDREKIDKSIDKLVASQD